MTRLEGNKNVALMTKDNWINYICLCPLLPLLLAQMDQCCLLILAAYLPLDDPNDPQNDPGSIVALDKIPSNHHLVLGHVPNIQ